LTVSLKKLRRKLLLLLCCGLPIVLTLFSPFYFVCELLHILIYKQLTSIHKKID
jgi:hypothetical protein